MTHDSMIVLRRRRYVQYVSVGILAGLAGCPSRRRDQNGTEGSTDYTDDTSTGILEEDGIDGYGINGYGNGDYGE